MVKFKILRAVSQNNETVEFDEGESIVSARSKVGAVLGKDGNSLNLIFMGRFLLRDEQVREAIVSTIQSGHDGVLHVSPKIERSSFLSDVESAVQERNTAKKKFIIAWTLEKSARMILEHTLAGDELDSRALPDPLEVGEAINYEVRDGIVYDLDFANLLDEVAEDYGKMGELSRLIYSTTTNMNIPALKKQELFFKFSTISKYMAHLDQILSHFILPVARPPPRRLHWKQQLRRRVPASTGSQ